MFPCHPERVAIQYPVSQKAVVVEIRHHAAATIERAIMEEKPVSHISNIGKNEERGRTALQPPSRCKKARMKALAPQ